MATTTLLSQRYWRTYRPAYRQRTRRTDLDDRHPRSVSGTVSGPPSRRCSHNSRCALPSLADPTGTPAVDARPAGAGWKLAGVGASRRPDMHDVRPQAEGVRTHFDTPTTVPRTHTPPPGVSAAGHRAGVPTEPAEPRSELPVPQPAYQRPAQPAETDTTSGGREKQSTGIAQFGGIDRHRPAAFWRDDHRADACGDQFGLIGWHVLAGQVGNDQHSPYLPGKDVLPVPPLPIQLRLRQRRILASRSGDRRVQHPTAQPPDCRPDRSAQFGVDPAMSISDEPGWSSPPSTQTTTLPQDGAGWFRRQGRARPRARDAGRRRP